MKKTLLVLSMIVGSALIFNSCKKDDDASASTNTEKITGTWTASDLILGGQSLWSSVEDCSKDDNYTFKADGTGTFDEGATKCDPDDPQSEPATWKFIDNETKLVLDGDTSTILELTNNSLKMEYVDDQFTVEAHYKK